MNFEEVRAKATSEWEKIQHGSRPCVLIGAGTCGNSAGAVEVKKAVHEALSEHGIDAEVLDVGCIGMCYLEPMVDVVKPGKIIYELEGVPEETAKEAMRLASNKLSIRTRFITRQTREMR